MSNQPVLHGSASRDRRVYDAVPPRLLMFAVFALLLSLCFFGVFKSLTSLALHDELHSHVFLIPFIAIYILYIIRDQLPKNYRSSLPWAILALTGGIAFLIIASARHEYWLPAIMLSFVCFLSAGGFAFLGRLWMKAAAFPFAFLLFMVPLPDAFVRWLENASKLASADCASFFLHLTGTPVLRDGTIFQLPGIVIEVAQECSGIRSSWVLLIASVLAAYLFLRRPSNRLILVAVAIPLGVLRNGFRITVIGLLCVRFGPQMIHHPIHRNGGPLFFVLSLIPLVAILWLLRRNEDRFRARIKTQRPPAANEPAILTDH
jgi:exosortase C (VPDSG-CTERM-specific)